MNWTNAKSLRRNELIEKKYSQQGKLVIEESKELDRLQLEYGEYQHWRFPLPDKFGEIVEKMRERGITIDSSSLSQEKNGGNDNG